ncbi:MAG TPA: hypothetical protein VFT33_06595 [Gaiellaceae bacterium]|nr:hypothetical protein [Gaiellaceae bacterium]
MKATTLPGKEKFMKVKLFLTCLAVAGLAVSSAVAAPPEGKGKPRTGDGCKPQVTVVLKGTLTGTPSTTALDMNVTGANRWGRVWKGGTAHVTLDTKTKVRGGGMKTTDDLAKLKAGDRVLVQARVCKDDLKDNAKPATLTATKVIGHPAKAPKNDEDDD